jgi:dipeptidyl aminopeptidase/acylaminoacyl peptidase
MRLVTWLCVWLCCAGAALAQPAPRPLVPRDLASIEALGEVVPSPDGARVAFVRVRPKTQASTFGRLLLAGGERADVWVAGTRGRAYAVSDGRRDGTGFFLPAWSPDGRRLAMLSTRGGGITLWVWHRDTRRLRRVSSRSVEFVRPVWQDRTTLLCAAPLPSRPSGAAVLDTASARHHLEAWPRAFTGRDVTASVLRTGETGSADPRLQGHLLRFTLGVAEPTVLADGAIAGMVVAPGGRSVAVVRAARLLRPVDGTPLPNVNPVRYELTLLPASGAQTTVADDVLPGTVAWSTDGSHLSVGVYPSVTTPPRLARFRSRGTAFERLPEADTALAAREALWADASVIIARSATPGDQQRWTIVDDSRARPLQVPAGGAIERIVRAEPGAVLAASGTGLWRVDLRQGTPARLITRLQDERLALPQDADGTRRVTTVLVRGGTPHSWWVVDVASGSRRGLPALTSDADVVALLPATGGVVTRESSRRGTFLRIADPGAVQARTLVAGNTFLGGVAEARLERVDYTLADGTASIAWLLVPAGAAPGVPLPTVVWVYGGLVYGATPPRVFVPLNSPGTLNVQVLAARGYAVLLPSMPLGPEGVPGDPHRVIPGTVLPAVDAAIATGRVDSERLAVIGHSFGGYAVYSLITQTARFRAAIAMAGAANLVSLYGQLDPRQRHLDQARDRWLAMVFAESGQYRMGGPPGRDMARYVRNSPINEIDQVQTPTLIVQGDLDYVPMQQGEEFFTGLYRRGVPAEFVRYWGEGHVIESPPNVVDLWERVIVWLDRHLRPPHSFAPPK